MVLSMAINKYVHIALQKVAVNHIKVMYSEVEQVQDVLDIKHDLVKAALTRLGPSSNIEIASFADIPTKGTGLGSSSSFTVGLIRALLAHHRINKLHGEVAELACQTEIIGCNKKIGKQDQYAATYGGFRQYTFSDKGVAQVPVPLNGLDRKLRLVYTGLTRDANEVLSYQVNSLQQKDHNTFASTQALADMVPVAIKCLEENRLDDVGAMLNDAWHIKRVISRAITSAALDAMYSRLLIGGALGAKLLGAGGGGYFLAYVPTDKQEKFDELFHGMPFYPDFTGSQVLLND